MTVDYMLHILVMPYNWVVSTASISRLYQWLPRSYHLIYS